MSASADTFRQSQSDRMTEPDRASTSHLFMNPMEEAEHVYHRLVAHYAEQEHAEIRAAEKLLVVALAKFRSHGGPHWEAEVFDYLALVREPPARRGQRLQQRSCVRFM